jgi:uncharacterized PurR-regulated membrane protein YhhQ (DUF165 family)
LSATGRQIGILIAVASMATVVVLSNVLVQHPFAVTLGRLNLADLLTWGAFSYPLAFLVTDTTNRLLGPRIARSVVYCGFAIAVVLSAWFATPRIAIASGTAFLVGQLLDIGIFNLLRERAWWKAPAFSSLAGSAADTALFFALAFAPAFVLIGPNDPFAIESAPFLGLYPQETPRWVSWAFGDFSVKLAMAVFALIPYRVIVGAFVPLRPATR